MAARPWLGLPIHRSGWRGLWRRSKGSAPLRPQVLDCVGGRRRPRTDDRFAAAGGRPGSGYTRRAPASPGYVPGYQSRPVSSGSEGTSRSNVPARPAVRSRPACHSVGRAVPSGRERPRARSRDTFEEQHARLRWAASESGRPRTAHPAPCLPVPNLISRDPASAARVTRTCRRCRCRSRSADRGGARPAEAVPPPEHEPPPGPAGTRRQGCPDRGAPPPALRCGGVGGRGPRSRRRSTRRSRGSRARTAGDGATARLPGRGAMSLSSACESGASSHQKTA
jgi:hypothetical protein